LVCGPACFSGVSLSDTMQDGGVSALLIAAEADGSIVDGDGEVMWAGVAFLKTRSARYPHPCVNSIFA
jgi:hypothetical protein